MMLRPVSQYSTKYHPARGKTILDKRSDQGTLCKSNHETRFRPEDSEKAPGGCGACERISTRTSVREKIDALSP